ncbi:hypothetical protein BB559_007497 [Furculomyces boomerangus]|uniref:Large ribosomal subunit protein uL30m n=2 Tax=Harpellales TaxID=61421 RepID=A0A2T9XX50_9FUNG|nr:hypothetical protein BB559_007497 [Furculomyces boomerangus]PVZ98973.1 hypothetical protein BB558_005027 [Smittium angustum]
MNTQRTLSFFTSRHTNTGRTIFCQNPVFRSTFKNFHSSGLVKSELEIDPNNSVSEQPKNLYKIKLIRSLIGVRPKARKNALAIGLKRTGNIVYHPVTNEMAGIILKIKELVHLEVVDKKEPIRKKQPLGYEIVKEYKPFELSK